MVKGEDIHSDKEAELYELVEVVPKTKEDKILMKLHNTMVALEGFKDSGIAREIPVWGRFNSLKVVGIVDELKTEDGRLIVADTKTRKSDTLPRIAQSRPTRFQLMAYKELFDEISHGDYKPEDLLHHYGFTVESSASPEFVQQHKDHGIEFEANVLKSAEKAFSMFKEFPIIDKMRVSYEHQDTKKTIGTDEFSFDYEHFWSHCKFCEGFWRGERVAVPVSEYNSWKCSYCQYKDECEAVKKFAQIQKPNY
jgi:exonuclease V